MGVASLSISNQQRKVWPLIRWWPFSTLPLSLWWTLSFILYGISKSNKPSGTLFKKWHFFPKIRWLKIFYKVNIYIYISISSFTMCSNSDLQSRTKGTVWLITEMSFLFLWEPWPERSVMALILIGLHSLWLTFISRNEYRFPESIQPLTILIAEPQKDSNKNMRWIFFYSFL